MASNTARGRGYTPTLTPTGRVKNAPEKEGNNMLTNIEKCTTARLATIWELAQEGISWAKNNKQLKDIEKELIKRGALDYLKLKKGVK